MARPKSLLKSVEITVVQRQHACRSNSAHTLQKGDRRLTVKEPNAQRHYCLACGRKFVERAMSDLEALLEEVGPQRR